MATSHRAAVLALLSADQYLTPFTGPAPRGTAPPYVVAYVFVDSEARSTINGGTNETNVRVITHSAAVTDDGVDVVSREVRLALLDQRPNVDGYLTTRIEHESGGRPEWQDETGQLIQTQIDEWTYTARPA